MTPPKTLSDSLLPTKELGLAALVGRQIRAYFEAHQDHLPPEGLYHLIWEEVEQSLFQETLKWVNGNQLKACAILGIHRNTLRRKLSRNRSLGTKT